jgi:hypothetical protein
MDMGSGDRSGRKGEAVAEALAVPERKRLVELETVIEAGLQTFMQVGSALLEIRTEKLYRETHATFADYCEQRWRFSDRRARQLMSAAEIGTTVPVPSERHARALVPLIASRGIEAAQDFFAQHAEASAVDLDRAVRAELAPVAEDEPARRHLVAAAAALAEVEEAQRAQAAALVEATRCVIAAADEQGISDADAVGPCSEWQAHADWFSERGFALLDYSAMAEFAEGNGENEIERAEMLAWELRDNDVIVPFEQRHFVRWCEAERERAAA